MKRDDKQIRHVIDIARREINQQKPLVALHRLNEIRRDIDDCDVPSISADYQLTCAEALAARGDAAAEPEFESALRLVINLQERDPLLEIRVFEHFAQWLASRRKFSWALQHATSAKKIAVELQLFEDSARIQLLLVSIEYEIDKNPNPLQPAFQNFKAANREGDYTAQEQLAAWSQYLGDADVRQDGLLAARSRGSEEFFRRLLKSVREEHRYEISS